MLVPILKQDQYLIASFQEALSDHDLLLLRDRLAASVRQFRSRGILIDVSVLDVMDSFAARTLRSISEVMRLLGARTVIAGIQPEVAMAMVQLGITLNNTEIAMDLEDGLEILRSGEPDPEAADDHE